MKKILFILLVTCIFLFSIVFFNNYFLINAKADPQTIFVSEGESIQDAIDNANESDIVSIESGTYSENIEITKSITLTGDNKENTIIIGDAETIDTIKISASNVIISNLKIKTKTSSQPNLPAIYLNYASNCEITNCIIEDSNLGIWLKSSNDNTIQENIIKDNAGDGIMITSSSSDNIITENTIQENDNRGIYIDQTPFSNKIYKNDFIDNSVNARDLDDPTDNLWYLSGQGNNWSDYNNYDSDNDGIGDQPYTKKN